MPNFEDQIVFFGGADSDSSPRAVVDGDYRKLEYCRLGPIDGQDFCVITADGTILVENAAITTYDRILGVAYWIDRNAIIYFVYVNAGQDSIWLYDIDAQTHTLVAADSDFNFDPDWPIYHADVIDGILKWTDGRWDDLMYDELTGQRLFNPPYQINIQKALDGDYPSITLQVIDAIKWPPKAPVAAYVTDTTVSDNKIRNKLFKFRAQAIYENNEESVWSHYSNLAYPAQAVLVSGNNYADSLADNAIDVTFFTGPNVIKKINIAVQEFSNQTNGVETPFGIFLQYAKAADGSEDNINITIRFYGNVAEKQIENGDRNYDRLPIQSYCQAMLPSKQIAYTNFREGYDKTVVDVTVERVLTEVIWNTSSGVLLTTYIGSPNYAFKFEFQSVSVFNLNAGDQFNTTVTISVPEALIVELSYTLTFDDIAAALDIVGVANQFSYILTVIVNAYINQINAASDFNFEIDDVSDNLKLIKWDSGNLVGTVPSQTNPSRATGARPTLKTGATHPFGMVYYDRAERDNSVNTSEEMKLFVEFPNNEETNNFTDPNNPYTVYAKFTINHQPPIWAEYYRFVARDVTEISDFSQFTIIDIVPDEQRYKLSIQRRYQDTYIGATINHVPQAGDILRFIRKPLADSTAPDPSDYVEYFELEVMEYSQDEGIGGTSCVWVPQFTIQNVYDTVNNDAGQLVEIYTPRPVLDEAGKLFVSKWRVVSEAIAVIDPHTEDRAHGGSSYTGLVGELTSGSDTYFLIGGDYTFLLGYPIIIYGAEDPTFQDLGPVLTATYDSGTNVTTITALPWPSFSSSLGGGFVGQTQQDFQLGIPAVVNLDSWGDVWLRQRFMDSSYALPNQMFYYWIEDPHFSDYWLSMVNGVGEIAIQSPYFKMVHRLATSIHSETYIDASQINGLSSFNFDLKNIQDLDDQYGEVFCTEVDGKTLKCLQPRKENSIYVQGSFSVTADGQSAPFANSGKTFASWRPYQTLYGTMDAGSVVLMPTNDIAYWDRTSGSFIVSSENGQINISEKLKYKNRSQEIKNLFSTYNDVSVRSYINERDKEIGWCFSYDNENQFTIVTYNYDKRRFVGEYGYNFRFFGNIGEAMVGWGVDNQLYVHNQPSLTFHGENFIQKVVFISNEDPSRMKRYQNITIRANKTWDLPRAYAETNQSYVAMETQIQKYLFNIYEGYQETYYRRNRFTPNKQSEELALMTGEEVRANALTHEITFAASEENSTTILFSVSITGVYS